MVFKSEIPYNFCVLIDFLACVTTAESMCIEVIVILRGRENSARGQRQSSTITQRRDVVQTATHFCSSEASRGPEGSQQAPRGGMNQARPYNPYNVFINKVYFFNRTV